MKDPDNTPVPEAAKKNIEVNVHKAQKMATAAGIAEGKTDKTSVFIIVIILVMLIAIAFLWYERQHRAEMTPVFDTQVATIAETPSAPAAPAQASLPAEAPPIQPLSATTSTPAVEPATPADKLPPDPSMISSVPSSVDPTMAAVPPSNDATTVTAPPVTPPPLTPPGEEVKPKDGAKPFQSTIDITPPANHIASMPHITSQENIVATNN